MQRRSVYGGPGSCSFTPTKLALEDSLDRLLRFFGKANFDPEIQPSENIGDDQEFFKILRLGAQSATNKLGLNVNLEEFTLPRIIYWLEGRLDSKEFIENLTKVQRDKLQLLMTSSRNASYKDLQIRTRSGKVHSSGLH